MLLFKKSLINKQYGDYKIISFLNEGRFGECYLAVNKRGEQAVMKRFKTSLLKKDREDHAYEAIMLSQIEHPAIPQLLGVIHTPKIYAFILEYKKGDTLAELLFKRNVSFTTEQIFNIGLQLIDIVKYLHRKGIVHRDISVANVLLYEGKISLIDFGLARWADHQDYRFDNDFSYIGDLFLYLLYSSFEATTGKSRPWHEELLITPLQKQFLKRMLRLEQPFQHIDEVEESFKASFGMDS